VLTHGSHLTCPVFRLGCRNARIGPTKASCAHGGAAVVPLSANAARPHPRPAPRPVGALKAGVAGSPCPTAKKP